MKICVISDIHGNYRALSEVLKLARKLKVDRYFVLGDLVGYYYHPDKVLELLEPLNTDVILGNHEVLLRDVFDKKIDIDLLNQKYGRGHELALEKLSSESLNWLFSLPAQKSIEIGNTTFQLNHGSPHSTDQYLYPNTNPDILESCNSNEHDFVLVGHSHYSFTYKCKHSILINCGSVGQSREYGGQAFWALIDTHDNSYQIMNSKYSINGLIEDIKKYEGKLGYSAKVLTRKKR